MVLGAVEKIILGAITQPTKFHLPDVTLQTNMVFLSLYLYFWPFKLQSCQDPTFPQKGP